jgi:hypothetical protein
MKRTRPCQRRCRCNRTYCNYCPPELAPRSDATSRACAGITRAKRATPRDGPSSSTNQRGARPQIRGQAYCTLSLNVLLLATILRKTRYLQAALGNHSQHGTHVRIDLAPHFAPLSRERMRLSDD